MAIAVEASAYGNKDGKSAFICPCHQPINVYSDGSTYCKATMMTRGPGFSDALPDGVSWEMGSKRNGSKGNGSDLYFL